MSYIERSIFLATRCLLWPPIWRDSWHAGNQTSWPFIWITLGSGHVPPHESHDISCWHGTECWQAAAFAKPIVYQLSMYHCSQCRAELQRLLWSPTMEVEGYQRWMKTLLPSGLNHVPRNVRLSVGGPGKRAGFAWPDVLFSVQYEEERMRMWVVSDLSFKNKSCFSFQSWFTVGRKTM